MQSGRLFHTAAKHYTQVHRNLLLYCFDHRDTSNNPKQFAVNSMEIGTRLLTFTNTRRDRGWAFNHCCALLTSVSCCSVLWPLKMLLHSMSPLSFPRSMAWNIHRKLAWKPEAGDAMGSRRGKVYTLVTYLHGVTSRDRLLTFIVGLTAYSREIQTKLKNNMDFVAALPYIALLRFQSTI